MTHRGSGQQGSYSRQVFLAVWVINVYVNTERRAPLQKCELSTSTIQAETETGGIGGRRRSKGIHTIGGKINAICLSHHAFPKYISAFLSPRQKLYWGTLSYCPPLSPPPSSAPLTGPHCNLQLFTSTFLISHARISERSTILINVSCFSAPPVQGIIHTQGPCEVWGWGCGGPYWHSKKWPQAWTDSVIVCPTKRLVLSLRKKWSPHHSVRFISCSGLTAKCP